MRYIYFPVHWFGIVLGHGCLGAVLLLVALPWFTLALVGMVVAGIMLHGLNEFVWTFALLWALAVVVVALWFRAAVRSTHH